MLPGLHNQRGQNGEDRACEEKSSRRAQRICGVHAEKELENFLGVKQKLQGRGMEYTDILKVTWTATWGGSGKEKQQGGLRSYLH